MSLKLAGLPGPNPHVDCPVRFVRAYATVEKENGIVDGVMLITECVLHGKRAELFNNYENLGAAVVMLMASGQILWGEDFHNAVHKAQEEFEGFVREAAREEEDALDGAGIWPGLRLVKDPD